MPLLRGLEDEFSKTKPFENVRISLSVHLEAKRLGLKGIPKDELPKFGPLFVRQGYLLIPLVELSERPYQERYRLT